MLRSSFLLEWNIIFLLYYLAVDSALLFDDRKFSNIGAVPSTFYSHFRNKRVTFIGDSVTRYQYLSLAYALHTGVFPNISIGPYLVEEHSYSSWLTFFQATAKLISPFEICDCYRPVNVSLKLVQDYSTENRFYFNNRENVSLIFLWHFDFIGYQGHWWGPETDQNHVQFPIESFTPNSWKVGALAFPGIFHKLKDFYSRNPDAALNVATPWIVIMNVGHHFHEFATEPWQMQYIVNSSKTNGVSSFIWKTTTFAKNHPLAADSYYNHDKIICKMSDVVCFDTSWTHDINASALMWDNYHFKIPVYNALNIELGNMITKLFP
jgi:hypothetical protein